MDPLSNLSKGVISAFEISAHWYTLHELELSIETVLVSGSFIADKNQQRIDFKHDLLLSTKNTDDNDDIMIFFMMQ